jgi:hypothetical protein
MAMDLIGRFVKALPVESGQSARGEWKRQSFIIETEEQYPRKVCISLWGERLNDIVGIQPGELLTISVSLESREYNERWYTDARAWRIQRGMIAPTPTPAAAAAAPHSSAGTQAPTPPTPTQDDEYADAGEGEQSFDDLPF